MLSPAVLPRVQRALADLDLDAWLLYDFRGCNPIAQGILGLDGLQTRRNFGFIPREGVPTAVIHRIEPGPWARWPNEWRRIEYSGWRELEQQVSGLVQGRRVAMEYSAGDAVPVLDRVPAGIVDFIRSVAKDVLSSGELVSSFYATLDARQIAAHSRAAEAIAQIARQAMQQAGDRARSGKPAPNTRSIAGFTRPSHACISLPITVPAFLSTPTQQIRTTSRPLNGPKRSR